MSVSSVSSWIDSSTTSIPVLLPEEVHVEWKSPDTFPKDGTNPALWPWFGECVMIVRGERWTIKSFVGGGCFGQVYFAEYQRTGQTHCIKFVRDADDDEVKFLKSAPSGALQHPNILKVLGLAANIDCPEMSFDYYSETCEGSESVKRVANHMIFMEAVPNGDLLGMLKAGLKMQTNLSEGTMLHFVRDIISGASHLAQKGLAHRDLKLANLMLDRQGRIVIIDFGHVKGGSSASTDPSSAAADQGILRPMSGKVECVGTRGYHAPERFINFSGQATVEVGSWVRITTDPAIYERECRASELSWPNLSDGRPRTIKMGAEGCIEDIDFDDMTVRLSDGLKWLPIRALVGFEDYEATYDSELADVFTLGLVVAKMKSSETPFKDHPQDFDSLAQDGLTQNAWHAWQQDVRGCYRANSFQQDPGFSNELKSFLDCLWRRNPQDPNRPRPRFADLEKAMDNDQETLTKFSGLQWLASGCPSSPLDFVRELQTLQPNLSLQHSVVARTLGDYVFSHQRSLGQAGWKVACQDAYHAAKASQNGKLTVEELASSVKPYGPKRGSAVPLAALMIEHTNENDGVTFQEFEQMVKGARPVARPLAQPENSASMRDREELARCIQSHIKVHA